MPDYLRYVFCCVLCFQFIFRGVKTVHVLSVSSASGVLLDSGQPSICFYFLAENVVFFFIFYSELHVTSVLCIFYIGVLQTLTGTNIVFFPYFDSEIVLGMVYVLINSTAVSMVDEICVSSASKEHEVFDGDSNKVRFCKFRFHFNFFHVQTVHILSISAASHISLDSGQPSIHSLAENVFFFPFLLFSLLQQVTLWFAFFLCWYWKTGFLHYHRYQNQVKLFLSVVLDFKICGCVVYFVPFYSSFP